MYKPIKRLLDVVFALVGLALGLIPGVLLAILIKLDSNGPVFFKQKRYGKGKKVFEIYKFRTMKSDAPSLPPYAFREAEKYITRLGGILRRWSLDELPQIINIIKGEMSLIGPRPGAAINEEKLADLRTKYGVFAVRPGLTGWAQVNGRDELAHNELSKTKYDAYYVKNISFKLDLICILKTFGVVVNGVGYHEGLDAKPANRKLTDSVLSYEKEP